MPLASWPRLVAITDVTTMPPAELIVRLRGVAARAVPNTVALLLRDHQLPGRQRLELGAALRDVARSHQQQLWVADRLDLALLLEADVLHLGEGSVRAAVARRMLPPSTGVSRAWHSAGVGELEASELEAVDALLLSPVILERKGRPALGLQALSVLGEQLRARHQASTLFALGGVTALNAEACLRAGASGVAAIGAATAADATPLLAALSIAR